MMRRAGSVLLGGLVLAACRPEPPLTSPEPPQPVTTEPSPQAPAPPTACGPAHQRFVTSSWAPPRARAVALVELDDPQLDDALSILAAGARDAERQLPIRVAFSLGQWTWQVPLLRRTLSQAGFEPAQLAYVALPDGTTVWAWPSTCDLETTTANLRTAWGLELRSTPYGAVALAPAGPDGTPEFAYDFVAWGASYFALVPAGRVAATTQQLGEPPTDPNREALGPVLDAVAPGPIRLALRMDELLAGTDAAVGDSITAHHIDAAAWTISDSETSEP